MPPLPPLSLPLPSSSCTAPSFREPRRNRLDALPDVVILQIANLLNFEDKINFMRASQRADSVVSRKFRKFTHVQISDEPFDSFLKAEARQLPNGVRVPEERLSFDPAQVEQVLALCVNLTSVVLAVKLSGSKVPQNGATAQQLPSSNATTTITTTTTACPLFDSSLYNRGGFIKHLIERVPQHLFPRLSSVCLNVDLLVESFSQLAVPCPTEDLRFAVQCLADQPFQTFIQIGFCANNFKEEDNETNCMLFGAMHSIAHEMRHYGCRAEVDVSEEYYCDLTVEFAQIEYSFAFFYYNPSFCDAGPSSMDVSLPPLPDDVLAPLDVQEEALLRIEENRDSLLLEEKSSVASDLNFPLNAWSSPETCGSEASSGLRAATT